MKKISEFDFFSVPGLATTFPREYLHQYYQQARGVTDDEMVVAKFFLNTRKSFLKNKTWQKTIEFGCGPTLHHAILVAPYSTELTLSDYLPDSLEEIRKWIAKDPKAWGWSHYTRAFLELDGLKGNENSITNREEDTRTKIKSLIQTNLLDDKDPNLIAEKYDLVSAYYCTEEIALDYSTWRDVIARLVKVLERGGQLYLACLLDTDFYHIQSPTGERSLPCLRITPEMTKQALKEVGFIESNIHIEVNQTPNQASEGVLGTISAVATK